MKITKNAETVLRKRYLQKNEGGEVIETPQDLFTRVSAAIASAERPYGGDERVAKYQKEFYDMMTNLEFLPNSPTLMNAGRPLGQLSACFVLPVEDTMEGIFETIKRAAIIHKSGGGTGFSFSRIRPRGATVNSTGGVASGPVSFMKVFNSATEAVKQGGTRRGANMGILRVDHPDILDFITCKEDTSEITNFNISVGVTEEFMNAALNGQEYSLIDPHKKTVVGTLNAAEVFDKIVDAAWRTGEPGIIFLDRLNRDNVVPTLGEIESTNPCGEQPLLPYESCNLGSINLFAMQKTEDGHTALDFDKLEKTVRLAVRFLDNVIDVNKYPIDEIGEMTRTTRKIGLGVMGFADLLFSMGIPYNSEEAVQTAEKIMKFINDTARDESAVLAKERGTFPAFPESTFKKDVPYRNATVTTIAPTGTLSIIAGVSSGIEPVFALSFVRNILDGTKMLEINPVFEKTAREMGFYSEDLMHKIAENGTLHGIDGIPSEIKKVFVTAHDITPIWHTKMQAAFQKYVDNAVSKTVNFPKDATREDVKEVFVLSHKLDCKGVTIYRDGSRDQVLKTGKSTAKSDGEKSDSKIVPRPRPEITTGFTEKVRIGCGNLYITVNYDENGICEVFTNTGRGGGCPSQSEATSRLVSIALRSGLDARALIEQLRGIRCPTTIKRSDVKVASCPDAIGRVIEKVLKYQNGNANGNTPEARAISAIEVIAETMSEGDYSRNARRCPECRSELEHEGGCVICRSCGYSKCG